MFDTDGHDIEAYYNDNLDEFDDYEDAYDAFLDDEEHGMIIDPVDS